MPSCAISNANNIMAHGKAEKGGGGERAAEDENHQTNQFIVVGALDLMYFTE